MPRASPPVPAPRAFHARSFPLGRGFRLRVWPRRRRAIDLDDGGLYTHDLRQSLQYFLPVFPFISRCVQLAAPRSEINPRRVQRIRTEGITQDGFVRPLLR